MRAQEGNAQTWFRSHVLTRLSYHQTYVAQVAQRGGSSRSHFAPDEGRPRRGDGVVRSTRLGLSAGFLLASFDAAPFAHDGRAPPPPPPLPHDGGAALVALAPFPHETAPPPLPALPVTASLLTLGGLAGTRMGTLV